MRFLFVDRIAEIGVDTITGEKHFAVDAPMQYATPGLAPEISPAVVSEAIGQLVSWHALARNDFSGRAVFMFADRIAIHGPTRPGDTVSLAAKLDAEDQEAGTFVFSGAAKVDGNVVVTVEGCHGYFMPLQDLEDPLTTRLRYASLINGGLRLDNDSGAFAFGSLTGELVDVTAGVSAVTRKTFATDELFYADHFPRFPVTPIVMINEMIGQAAGKLWPAQRLTPRAVEGIKIRNFVRPGETVETRVELIEQRMSDQGMPLVVTSAEVKKDGKTILRGRYTYELGA